MNISTLIDSSITQYNTILSHTKALEAAINNNETNEIQRLMTEIDSIYRQLVELDMQINETIKSPDFDPDANNDILAKRVEIIRAVQEQSERASLQASEKLSILSHELKTNKNNQKGLDGYKTQKNRSGSALNETT